MGWLGFSIEKFSTQQEVLERWYDLQEEIPGRTAGINSLSNFGKVSTEKEAREILENREIVGMGYVTVQKKESAKLRDAQVLYQKENQKLRDFIVKSSVFKTHSGKTVGCRSCGSSFPVDYFRRDYSKYRYHTDCDEEFINRCPICGEDMRPESTLKRIDGYKANIVKYRERIKKITEEEGTKSYILAKEHVYLG